jgi:N6-adenosine-specific RNA methylase IME4
VAKYFQIHTEGISILVEWLKDCEICNAGLCVRVDELKPQLGGLKPACKEMEAEAAEELGRPVWTAAQIRQRYLYYKGKRGRNPTPQKAEFQTLEGIAESLESLIEEGKQFSTIYADPPWAYQNQGTRGATSGIYKVKEWKMTLEELSELPIPALTAENAHLHLWTTNAFLPDSFNLIEAWGFEYKSVFVWVKPQLGIGNYWRVSHEFLMLGTKGKNITFPDNAAEKSWRELRRGKHSQKPEEIAEILEKVSPGPYLELFARRPRKGWTVWGNEVKGDLFTYGIGLQKQVGT